MKIGIKIILPALATAALGLFISTLISYRLSTAALEIASEASQKMAIANAIVELEAGIQFNVFNAVSLAQTGLLQPYLAGTEEEKLANGTAAQTRIVNMRKTYLYSMLGIINTDGQILKHTEEAFVGQDFSEEPFFKGAMQGKVSVGNPFRHEDAVVYTVASPVYSTKEGEDKKIIGVVFNVSRLSDTMSERMRLGEKGYVLVAGSDGRVFIHKDPSLVLTQDFNDSAWGQEMLKNNEGEIVFEDNKENRKAYYVTLADTGWLAVAAVNIEEMQIPSMSIRDTSIIISIVVLLCLALIIYYCTSVITSALNKAVKYSEEIATGELNNTLELHTKDELGKLAEALRKIPVVLHSITTEYYDVEKRVEGGELTAVADFSKFPGDFAKLATGTNAVLGRFKMIMDSIPSPVVVLDLKLNAKYLNTVAIKLTTKDYFDMKSADLFHCDDDHTETDGLIAVAKTGKPEERETIARPNGKEMNIKYNVIPIYNDAGKLVSILQLITDLTSIKKTQSTILNIAEQAASISERVATASQELSHQLSQSEQNSSEQAIRITETTTSMGEMNRAMIEMTMNARSSSEASTSAKNEAETGAGIVQKAVDSIEIVQMQSIKLKDGMSKLDESAKAISQIMDTISDIADQTNLLALNAAIEAARAGEAGRGFSVVADEVRKLAEKTMLSTTEVGSTVEAIQANISESILQVEEAVKGIKEATEFANQSGSALNTIVGMVDNAADQSRDIAATSEEQSATSEQVNSALTSVNTIANETVQNMQEATRAVLELTELAEALFKLIDEMKRI